jgi:prepilin-type N-terminal cleavage/methylation domain-containing protein
LRSRTLKQALCAARPCRAAVRAAARQTEDGFTLVELLVVVALLTVLAGLLFPVLAQARDRARQTTCLSNLRQIGQAQLQYLEDWDERFPDWFLPGPPRPAPFGPRRFWPELMQPYLRSDDVFRDPSAVWSEAEDARLADYALMTAGPGGRGTEDEPYWRWPGPTLFLAAVVRPSETIQLLDGWTTTGWTLGPIPRHRGGVDAGFVDGHAHWLPAKELARLDRDEHGFYRFHYAAADR